MEGVPHMKEEEVQERQVSSEGGEACLMLGRGGVSHVRGRHVSCEREACIM